MRKILTITIALSILIIALSSAYYFKQKNEISIKNANLRAEELKLSQQRLEYQKKKNADAKEEKETNATLNIIKDNQDTQQVNLELISLDLKTRINTNQRITETLLTAVYNNPNEACSSIVTNKTTQNHIYYIIQSFYNSAVTDYGQYRESNSGIDNSLTALQKTLQIAKDKCAAVGYQID